MMPRNISFALTTPQVIRREKTVTRRTGWKNLKVGEVLQGVEKGMGLKPGESIKRLGLIRVVSLRWEPLDEMVRDLAYGEREMRLEGFPFGLTDPREFVEKMMAFYKVPESELFHRIEFEYLDGDFAGQLK